MQQGGRIRLQLLQGEQRKVLMRSSPHQTTVHRTVVSRWVRIHHSTPQKVQHRKVLDFLWWGRTDSNHRSETQQIYSLSPLATRELPRICDCCLHQQNICIIPRMTEKSSVIFKIFEKICAAVKQPHIPVKSYFAASLVMIRV